MTLTYIALIYKGTITNNLHRIFKNADLTNSYKTNNITFKNVKNNKDIDSQNSKNIHKS